MSVPNGAAHVTPVRNPPVCADPTLARRAQSLSHAWTERAESVRLYRKNVEKRGRQVSTTDQRDSGAEPDALRVRIARVLAAFPEIQAAYLFGSAAVGRATRESDLDLAVVVDQPLGGRKLDILMALAEEGFDRVDLVSLDTDDVVLRFEAVRPNCLAYARQGFDHGAYYSRVVREYFDFMPFLQRQREAMRRRLQRAPA